MPRFFAHADARKCFIRKFTSTYYYIARDIHAARYFSAHTFALSLLSSHARPATAVRQMTFFCAYFLAICILPIYMIPAAISLRCRDVRIYIDNYVYHDGSLTRSACCRFVIQTAGRAFIYDIWLPKYVYYDIA